MKPIVLVLAALTALVAGCAGVFTSSYNYNLEVKNAGKQRIWCSLVASSKGMSLEYGRLIPGARKIIAGPFKLPYADKWTVVWETAKGEKFEKTLDLAGKFPKAFEGYLVFTIDAANNLSFGTEPFYGK